MDIGRALEVIRTKRKMSRANLAESSGLTRMSVFRVEVGRQDPTLGTLERLAKALDVSLTHIVRQALMDGSQGRQRRTKK